MGQQNQTKPEENQSKPAELSEKDLEPVIGGRIGTNYVQYQLASMVKDSASGQSTGFTADAEFQTPAQG